MRDEIERRQEDILWEGKPQFLSYLFRLDYTLYFLAKICYQFLMNHKIEYPSIVVLLAIEIFRFFSWRRRKYALSNKALYLQDNFLGEGMTRIAYEDVHSLRLEKKLFGKGTIVVNPEKNWFARNFMFLGIEDYQTVYQEIAERVAIDKMNMIVRKEEE